MAGIKQISGDIKTKCPHCNKSLDLTEVGPAIFRKILETISRSETVSIPGFGRFSVSHYPSKMLKVGAGKLKGEMVEMPAYWRIVFKAAAPAKRVLRERLGTKPKRVPIKRKGSDQ